MTCNEGGVEYEVESTGDTQLVCNGNPAEYPDHLLSGKSETGTWSFDANAAAGGRAITTISFPVGLGTGLNESHVHFQGETATDPGGDFEASCHGNVLGPEVVASGNLCVYKSELSNVTAGFEEFGEIFKISKLTLEANGSSPIGAVLSFTVTSTGPASGFGAWAVKG